jgi:hypothetical protein
MAVDTVVVVFTEMLSTNESELLEARKAHFFQIDAFLHINSELNKKKKFFILHFSFRRFSNSSELVLCVAL